MPYRKGVQQIIEQLVEKSSYCDEMSCGKKKERVV